jgi:hypothetical protein
MAALFLCIAGAASTKGACRLLNCPFEVVLPEVCF